MNATPKSGFTLVELAIVVVIAGILAAVAVPIYQGIIDESKWSEARMAIGSIRTAISTYKAKQSGSLAGLSAGPISNLANVVKLDANSFNSLKYFRSEDFTLESIDANSGTYTIKCDGTASLNPESPDGVLRVDNTGNETGP